jgi:drug/metabolite transporter (DMT)-like permease
MSVVYSTALVADHGAGEAPLVGWGADHGQVAQALGQSAGAGVGADQPQVDVGVAGRPLAPELQGVAAQGRPGMADAQAPVAGGGLVDQVVGIGQHRSCRCRRWRPGRALMLGSALSNQVGAATGALAFPVIGPAGVVAVRQWVAGALLWAVGRPRIRRFTWPQWWPVLSLALVFATMNLSLYTAIGRIGLGLAVTLEFLGPLGVALAASRRRVDLACALAAGVAVVVLSSAVPFLADPLALRRVPARYFGVFMSVNPVLAALVGLVVLGQSLGWAEWLAIATIVGANTLSVADPP